MTDLVLFCIPKEETYKHLSELEIAQKYTQMAIEDYDSFISFDPQYSEKQIQYNRKPTPQIEVPDYEATIGRKNGLDLMLSLFSQQPVTKIGNIKNKFITSSYLFNIADEDASNLLLPDLDVVELTGQRNLINAAMSIRDFYQSYGWQVHVHDQKLKKERIIETTSTRLGNEIKTFKPNLLRNIAHEKLGYELFGPSY